MHLKFCLVILFIGFFIRSNAQKYDHQWAFGYEDLESEKFGISILDFNNGEVSTYYKQGVPNYGMSFSGSFLNHLTLGQLTLNTGGCRVYDGRFEVISDTDWIHGDKHIENCENLGIFPGSQNLILLPDLVNPDLNYLITKDIIISEVNNDVYSPNLYWSTIIQNQDADYEVSELKKINIDTLLAGDVTAVPNQTKDKWWLLQPRNQSDQIETYLIGDNNMELVTIQDSKGLFFDVVEQDVGQNTFSPDGTKYAFNSEVGVHLYDFDNETGLLSNYRMINYPNTIDDIALGLCFSSNNRFIYVTTATDLYQIDIELMDEPLHIAHHFSIDDYNYPVLMGMMFLAPDCRIYISPGFATHFLHVIHSPNLKGIDCLFQARAINTPSRVSNHLPNIPQYRNLIGCDPDIRFPFPIVSTNEQTLKKGFQIYPNPAVQTFHIKIYKSAEIEELVLVDLLGNKVKNIRITDNGTEVDVSELCTGVYFIKDLKGLFPPHKFIKL